MLVTVTLNENQLRAHLEPLVALQEVGSVLLVSDRPAPPIAKLRYVMPPPALVRVAGRAGAKLLVCLVLARRERPHWAVGLNLVPHGINAMLAAKVAGGQSLFHMIGGPREILGGGWCSDNAVLGRLPRPVQVLERLLFRLVRACDFVAVMGTRARRLLIERGMAADRVVPIPASVDESRFHPRAVDGHDYDLITVSQLIPRKRLDDFVGAVARLRETRPGVRAAIVGRGSVEAHLRALSERLGVADAIDFLGFRADVEELYARSRVFVLTSRSEGLSISIAEAMASGLPVVVTDVGEVRDLVREGDNGHLFGVGDVDALVRLTAGLLGDPERRSSLGRRAAADARAVCGRERVRALYRGVLAGKPGPVVPDGLFEQAVAS